jgi:ABC-type transporter Mla MlaB component
VLWDVKGLKADAATIDALARLQLAARRQGHSITLFGASDDLRALIAFMGLQDVLPLEPGPDA